MHFLCHQLYFLAVSFSLFLQAVSYISFINPYPQFGSFYDGGNPGKPLFLTPLINSNKIAEARVKSKVIGTQFLSVASYAGYLTVDKQYNSNLFFWYFPAEQNTTYAPVVVWLQGGPGATSLFGLFVENGPFKFSKGRLRKRKYRWSRKHHLIYIDNPVGTGFSFTDNEAGYARNEKQVGKNLYEAVRQLFLLFDFSATTGFWVTGESYGGKYVPALAYYIHDAQKNGGHKVLIPLKGVAIGNGLSDPQYQMNYGDYLYQLGLIDLNGHQKFTEGEKKTVECIQRGDMECADNVRNGLMSVHSKSLFRNLTGFDTAFNYLGTKPDNSSKELGAFFQSSIIRRAIHVGNTTFNDIGGKNLAQKYLKKDIMDSVAPWVAELLDSYTVCIYTGQLDIIIAYPLTMNYLQNLQFKNAGDYKTAKRVIWKVDGEIAGYKKVAGNLKEVLVRNAGHMVPTDQPKWMFDLITELTGTKS